MAEVTTKDAEQDVKIAVLDSVVDNATRRMELIHKRIDRVDERVTKSNEEIKERIRALEKWVWGAAAVLTAFVVAGTIVGELNLIPNSNDNTVHTN
jgi:Mg2+ and Co2+ transporter CorA|tara:strand:+ start:44 stop:331 length:288 start_codon:yes stop_codon:yes gene_type:complete